MLRLLRGSDAHEHILMSIYGYHVYSRDNVYSQCSGYCAGHVHDKDYHIRIWALYRHLTNIYNLAYTYMSIHTIHNVNYSARVYLHANADL